MKNDAHAITNSYWLREQSLRKSFDRLHGKHETEILVIGAGITGLSTAVELASRGHRVTVCEAETIGAGTTAGSSGHLDAHPEEGPRKLVEQIGVEKARAYTAMRLEAIDEIASRSNDDCDFTRVDGYHYSESKDDESRLRDDWKAAAEIGLDTAWIDNIPISRGDCGYKIAGMARLDCGSYLKRLAELAVAQGAQIYEKTLVAGPTEDHPESLQAGNGEIRFEQVVCAVHCNYTDAKLLYAATPPYQSYVIAARVSEALEDALFWDSSDPYYYIRRANSADPSLILAGGCDHRTGAGDCVAAMDTLEDWIQKRFRVEKIVHRWSAEFFAPTDGLPMIGLVPKKDNVWIATGLNGVGLTLGTAAGKWIADGIEGRSSPLADTLSPSRSGLSQPGDWVSEQMKTASNYAERVLPKGKAHPSRLCDGEGMVGKIDGETLAICRDRNGCEHRFKAVCPHMGGVVHWNEVEQTWDCPVHGGRFTADGTRIYGPPESDLEKA